HIKEQQAGDPVDPAMPGLRGAVDRSTRRIPPAGVGHTHPDYQEAQPEQADKPRPPDRSPPRAPDSPQPYRKGDAQRATDDKVSDLFPTLITQGKIAHMCTPGAVARPGRTLDQKHQDEQQRPDYTAEQQELGASYFLQNAHNGGSFLNRDTCFIQEVYH